MLGHIQSRLSAKGAFNYGSSCALKTTMVEKGIYKKIERCIFIFVSLSVA